ncbi:hypothetical protein EDD75_2226 [Thermodesulfitimonas autotrophica]|uniref:Uncharacterized protein n=1 Tax=Thermodesulfitimonas autotrophica TaxID=1894989 RepID=A0A3N5B8I1_9THEO|nr:hypothetical protein [Thermodesulfitimonas autotrophica]RPF42005.1 hypothetical protein EDD75_2226 [Thermodesulfitimonas autotrophica]
MSNFNFNALKERLREHATAIFLTVTVLVVILGVALSGEHRQPVPGSVAAREQAQQGDWRLRPEQQEREARPRQKQEQQVDVQDRAEIAGLPLYVNRSSDYIGVRIDPGEWETVAGGKVSGLALEPLCRDPQAVSPETSGVQLVVPLNGKTLEFGVCQKFGGASLTDYAYKTTVTVLVDGTVVREVYATKDRLLLSPVKVEAKGDQMVLKIGTAGDADGNASAGPWFPLILANPVAQEECEIR